MTNLTIDGHKVTVPSGTLIVEAAARAGVGISEHDTEAAAVASFSKSAGA